LKPTTILFIRHGEAHNPKNIVYGRLPRVPLSKKGREQAALVAQYLKREHIAAIYTSPMLRARQTAHIFARYHPRAPVIVSEHLNEVRTSYQGISLAEMEKLDWNFYDLRRAPDDETPEDILARLLRLKDKMLARHRGQTVVWIGHGDPIAILRLWARGYELIHKNMPSDPWYIGNCSVMRFEFHNPDGRPKVTYWEIVPD